MSTKVSKLSQLFSANQVDASNPTKGNEKKTSVQFSELLNRNATLPNQTNVGQNSSNKVSAAPKQDYNQFQYKDNAIQQQKTIPIEQKAVSLTEKMGKTTEQIKDVLKEELQVSDEQIEDAMATLGMQGIDLLNQNNLAQLVSELTGENITDLICNESFQNIMQSVTSIGEDLFLELGITQEDFKDICSLIEQTGGQTQDETVELNTAETFDETANQGVLTDETNPDVAHQQVESDRVQKNVTDSQTQQNVVSPREVALEAKPAVEEVGTEEETQTEEPLVTVEVEENSDTSKSFAQNQQGSQSDLTQNMAEILMPQTTAPETVVLNQAEFADTYQQVIDIQNVMEQIVESARVTIGADTTKMEMQLNPENLGKIYMEITSKEGTISAKFVAQNDSVREALQAQMADLKQNLNQAGIKVDAVEVTVSSHEFEKNLDENAKQQEQLGEQQEQKEQSGRRTRRNINLGELDELSGVMSEEESLVSQIMQDNGNSMDLKA
ncbi:flagellar hook-length control protein FliK [Roseburia sp. 831b]|uniref:flagellar hook-length control protein FliK n=1 Tax=Roseburia sp. 831b TaxID=1261635 RepID=UPI000950E45F|nr:flagellar hook-length control protein FliK [Roseburia sp. 831b]WVK73844.1 flagellar hook-length control protein FliK [Roseburia sp. 831b]